MLTKEVPQDDNKTLEGERKAVYALDDNGKYTLVASSGWDVEETVTSMAVAHYQELSTVALQNVQQGLTSPLEYHMYARRLNIDTLAQAMGIFKWRVRRHLKPAVFYKLSEKMLSRYSQVLGITCTELKSIPKTN